MNLEELKGQLTKLSHKLDFEESTYVGLDRNVHKCEIWCCSKCKFKFVLVAGDDSKMVAVRNNKNWTMDLNSKPNIKLFQEYFELGCDEFVVKEILE